MRKLVQAFEAFIIESNAKVIKYLNNFMDD